MHFKTTGIVLKQRSCLNEQKYITLLTSEKGILSARVRIFGQVNKSVFRNINILGYYHFNIFDGRYGCVIDSAEAIEQFFNLRYDPAKLALAQYFCELTYLMVPSKQQASRHLNLLLNSLWLLQQNYYENKFIKCVFELRLLSLSGYMPNLVCCKVCCNYEKEYMFYVPDQGFLICSDCLRIREYGCEVKLTKPVLHAMRYIIYKEDKDIFKFKLEANHLNFLSKLVEKSVLNHIEQELVTLKIYHQFTDEFG